MRTRLCIPSLIFLSLKYGKHNVTAVQNNSSVCRWWKSLYRFDFKNLEMWVWGNEADVGWWKFIGGKMTVLEELHRKQSARLHWFVLFDGCFYKQKEQWVMSGTPEELRQRTWATNTSAGKEQQLLPSVQNPSQVRFTLSASLRPHWGCSEPSFLPVWLWRGLISFPNFSAMELQTSHWQLRGLDSPDLWSSALGKTSRDSSKTPRELSGIDFPPDITSLSSSVSCTSLISVLLRDSFSLQKALVFGSPWVDSSHF